MITGTVEGIMKWEMWYSFGWMDIVQRYKRSVIGPFWLTISSAITTLALCLIWAGIFKTDLSVFMPYFSLSNVVWVLVSTCIIESTQILISFEGLLRQVKLPISVLIFRMLWRNLIIFLHLLPIPLTVFFFYPDGFHIGLYQLASTFMSIIVLMIFLYVYCSLVAIMCTRYRDLIQVVISLTQLIFLATPILWQASSLSNRSYLYEYNPFYHLLQIVREPILVGVLPSTSYLIVMSLITVGGIVLGVVERKASIKIIYWL